MRGPASGGVAHGISGAEVTKTIAAMDAAMDLATAKRSPKSRRCLCWTSRRTGCVGTELHALGRSTDRAARGGSGAGVEKGSVLEIAVLSLGNVTSAISPYMFSIMQDMACYPQIQFSILSSASLRPRFIREHVPRVVFMGMGFDACFRRGDGTCGQRGKGAPSPKQLEHFLTQTCNE